MSIVENLKRIINSKKSIKEVVNQDFDKISDEKIDNYSSLIDETIEEYKNYIPTNKVTGESINITNAAPLAIKNGVIYSTEESKQETTEGYNLLGLVDGIYYNSSKTASAIVESGKISLSGTGVRAPDLIYIPLKEEISVPSNSTIYLSLFNDVCGESVNYVSFRFRTEQYDNYLEANMRTANATNSKTNNSGADDFINIATIRLNDETDTTGTSLTPILSYSNNLDYEKYTGGQASPNPNYPQEIETIKEITLKIKQNEEVTSIPIDLQGNEIVKLSDDVKDKLVIDKKGNISLNKKVGKWIFDSTNTCKYFQTKTNTYRYLVTKPEKFVKEQGLVKSNILNFYTTASENSTFNNLAHDIESIHCRDDGNGFGILINQDRVSSADATGEVLELLNNNYCYYELPNPKTIDLGNLSQLVKLCKGYNNIWIESNLGTTIELEYYKDYKLEETTTVEEEVAE